MAQQPPREGLHRRLRSRMNAELSQNVLDVSLDGFLTQVQLPGDLLVGLSLSKLVQNVQLAVSQSLAAVGPRSAVRHAVGGVV